MATLTDHPINPMNTNCPQCGARLGINQPLKPRCNHCGARLAYNALPFGFLISLAAVVLTAILLPMVLPVSRGLGRLQPMLISGLALLVGHLGLRKWPLYALRKVAGANKSSRMDTSGRSQRKDSRA